MYGTQSVIDWHERDLPGALAAIQHAIELYEKRRGPEYFLLGGAYLIRGETYERLGDYQKAESDLQKALAHFEKTPGKNSALDYLTKPIEPERLETTLALAKERLKSKAAMATQETFASVLANLETKGGAREKYPRRLLVPNGAKSSFVMVNDIEWIEAADYYSCLHVGANTFMLRETIKELANQLDPGKFVRIHRSIIVNVERVREILREGRSEGAVILASGKRLRMSKVGWERLLEVGGKS
jgi:DNA-binding LytR/AlgR family response regulator